MAQRFAELRLLSSCRLTEAAVLVRSCSQPLPTSHDGIIAPELNSPAVSGALTRTASTRGSDFPGPRSDFSRRYDRACPRGYSPAGQRIDVLHAGRQRCFAPAFAAVMGAEHFAIARGDINLLGVGMMQADRHQGAVRLHLVEALPGAADILAAVERAVLGGRCHAQARIKRVRVLRRHFDVAAIGERREAVDPQILPGFALVLA